MQLQGRFTESIEDAGRDTDSSVGRRSEKGVLLAFTKHLFDSKILNIPTSMSCVGSDVRVTSSKVDKVPEQWLALCKLI